MLDVYQQLREERAAKIKEFDSLEESEKEVRAAKLDEEIEGLDQRMDALVARLDTERRAAETAASFGDKFLEANAKTEEEVPELRQLIQGDLEARATVQVPTFLDSDTFYGKSILPNEAVLDFINRFDISQAPYKEYTEILHALGAVTFVDTTEAATLGPDGSPTIAEVSQVSTSKIYALASLTNEVIEGVPGIEADLVAKINKGYAIQLRNLLISTVNSATNSVNSAGADATLAESIQLLWETLPAEDKDDVIFLASASAISDLATDAGNDNFFYDPTTQQKTIQGLPVVLAPTLGGQTLGDTLVAAVNPAAISARASGLRVARDASVLFNTDSIAFRGTAYLGAAINSQDHVALLKKGV